jgi:uncharacterized protein (DUF2267 family)
VRAYREELFGPIAVVHRVAGEDEAVALANATPFGLGGSVFAADVDRAHRVAARLDAIAADLVDSVDSAVRRPTTRGVATQRNGPPVDLSYPDGWRYEQFIVTIQQKAGVSWAEAETAARATLGTLGERISRGDARALAGDLPDDLPSWLLDAGGADAEPFDAAEFVRRVAAREGVDLETAERHVRAVFVALARLVRRPEMSHLLAELPDDYAALLGDAASRTRDPGAPEVLAYEQFLQRVADRAALFPEQAGEVAAAVLEVLAERIAGGEADDLAQHLPDELRAALERGKARTGGKAQRMSLDEFVRRVAEREGVDYTQAFEHAGAVLRTLRDAVPDKEFSDLLHQLPRAYQEEWL